MPLLAASFKLVTPSFALLDATKKSTTTSSSSSLPILILIVIFVGVYFLFLRPQRQRMRQQQQVQSAAEVGDEVVTNSGIVGRVRRFDGDRAEIEVAPGTTIWIVRQALGRRVSMPPPVVEEPEPNEGPSDATSGDEKNEPS